MKALIAVSCVALLSACASTRWPTPADATAISGTPDHFLVLDVSTGARSEPTGPACRNPLVDPRDGTVLTLVRSGSGVGDYRLDSPKYGLRAGQLLRVDCGSGRPIGASSGTGA